MIGKGGYHLWMEFLKMIIDENGERTAVNADFSIVKNGLRLRDIVGKIAFGASRHYYQNIRQWLTWVE